MQKCSQPVPGPRYLVWGWSNMGNTNWQTSLNSLEFATITIASALRLFGLGERVKKCNKTKPHTKHSIFLQYSYVLGKAVAVISLIVNDFLPNVHNSITRKTTVFFWHYIETIFFPWQKVTENRVAWVGVKRRVGALVWIRASCAGETSSEITTSWQVRKKPDAPWYFQCCS